MKYIFCPLLLLAFACPALATAASATDGRLLFPTASLVAEYKWLQGPDSKGESILQLTWLDEQTLTPQTPVFTAEIFMPSMKMFNPPTEVSATTAPGTYLIQKIFFTMGGEWNVKVTVGSGPAAETQSIDLQLNDPMCTHQ